MSPLAEAWLTNQAIQEMIFGGLILVSLLMCAFFKIKDVIDNHKKKREKEVNEE